MLGFVFVYTNPYLVLAQANNCPIFPTDNVWNTPIDTLPVHPNSATYVNTIGATSSLHPDFGTVWNGAPNGIPFTIVPSTQKLVPIIYTDYGDESDPGPMPIPTNAAIEGGPNGDGDRHVLVIQTGSCKLYELFYAFPQPDGSWHAASGAVWNLGSHALRPATWTSADAAGLPMFPGLVRYEEVQAGAINHALRFTVPKTQGSYLWPARHHTTNQGAQYPPMGQRFRLKANFDISNFSPANQVILRALKKYGMFVADNGGAWFLSGAPNPGWNDDDLHLLKEIKGSNFEAVDESSLQIAADSGQAKQSTAPSTPSPTPPSPPVPSTCTQSPAAPVLLTPPSGAVVKVGPVTIDWADTTCATSYNVLVRRLPSSTSAVYQKAGLTKSQDVIPTLPKRSYYWSVSACNKFGCRTSSARKITIQ